MTLEQPDSSSPASSPTSSSASLRDHSLYYLARFPSTKVKLRKVLLRWAQRRGLKTDAKQLEELMGELQTSGYLDDEKFALARARSLLQRGASLWDIRARLAKDGIEREQIRETLDALTENEDREEMEILSALRVARKKRLGPFRSPLPAGREEREKNRKKDIASLARKGFGWGVVQKIMKASEEDLCAWQEKM